MKAALAAVVDNPDQIIENLDLSRFVDDDGDNAERVPPKGFLAMASLSPATVAAARSLDKFKATFKSFQTALAPAIFPVSLLVLSTGEKVVNPKHVYDCPC